MRLTLILNFKKMDRQLKKNTYFVIVSWLWLSIVIIASFVPEPKYYVRQLIKNLLKILVKPDMDKNVHFVFYFLMIFFFMMAYKNSKIRVLIFLGVVFISGIIEIIQPIITHSSRKSDINDFMFNVAGCTLGYALAISYDFLLNHFQNLIKTKPIL